MALIHKLPVAGMAVLMFSGCSSPGTPPSTLPSINPISTNSVVPSTTPPSDEPAAASATEICEGHLQRSGLVVESWDLVIASRGEPDHSEMIEGMADVIDSATESEDDGCAGSVELAGLAFELATLNASVVSSGNGEDSEYQDVQDAGNAWLKAIGETEDEFAAAPATPKGPSMTTSQEQAISKAQSYLDLTAFSKSGLIDQLKYEGFSPKDAKFAVEHIDVDWNEQAAKKAQSYLDMTSFSRKGLIRQLEYEGFTRKQAEYGADAVDL